MSFTYRAYGLTIRVPFACPALTPADADGDADRAAVDIVVSERPVPHRLPAPRAGDESWDASPGSFLLRGGRRAGQFLVEAGTVLFERNRECDDTILAQYFTGQVLAALLRHRGLLVLHANAVQVSDGAVAIGGESGSGKSTTAAMLVRRGCRMLSDDVTALRPGELPGAVEVVPGAAQTYLVLDTAEMLGYPVSPAQPQPWRRMKAAFSTHDVMASGAGPLRAVYLLRLSDRDEVLVTRATGGDAFLALQECLYGPMFAEEHPALFPLISAVAVGVPLFRLDRPSSRWSAGEVTDAILADAADRTMAAERAIRLGVAAVEPAEEPAHHQSPLEHVTIVEHSLV